MSTLAMALGVEIVTSGFLWGLMQTRRELPVSTAVAERSAKSQQRQAHEAAAA